MIVVYFHKRHGQSVLYASTLICGKALSVTAASATNNLVVAPPTVVKKNG